MKGGQQQLPCGCKYNNRYIFMCAGHDLEFALEHEAAAKTAWHDNVDTAPRTDAFEWMEK